MRNLSLIVATAGLLPAALAVGRWSPAAAPPPAPLPATAGVDAAPLRAEVMESLATETAARAPFRRSRRPAPVPYDPVSTDETPVSSRPVVPKPALVLTGFAFGRRPVAVLEGVPGLEGPLVLAEGETAAGLRIRRVRGSGVVVTGYDTLWTLVLKEPWR